MNELRRFILESHFDPTFAKAVYESISLLEAVNINKDYLIKEAGSPEKFAEAKSAVQSKWKADNMDAQLNQKAAQKVLNVLYLMEIRKPGFTDQGKLHSIHDLYLHNMLDTKFLNAVNSDSTPEQAELALQNAVEHQVQQQKVYPGLTADEEKIWNRVKVYHEFPDGFRWVYAVDDKGKIASHIPSSITGKTMNHCGNTPRAGSDDQYWELRDSEGKAYLTIILNNEGKLEESKSWGNQVSKYRRQIQPYVKWFLMDRVNGVGPRYDYGYSTHTNYGVKDFIGDDPEFIDYVTEFKPELLGNTEEKIMFWKGALDEGVVTKAQMKQMFVDKLDVDDLLKKGNFKEYTKMSKFKYDKSGSYHSSNVFGSNRFEVLCAACGGCPFTDTELKNHIKKEDIKLEEFVNYDIHLLTPEIQHAFVQADTANFDNILNLAEQVASFKVDDNLVESLIEPLRHKESNTYRRLMRYLATANPPDKVSQCAHEVLENKVIVANMVKSVGDSDYWRDDLMERMFDVFARFPDLHPIPLIMGVYSKLINVALDHKTDSYRRGRFSRGLLNGVLSLDNERGSAFLHSVETPRIVAMATPRKDEDFDDTMELTSIAAKLVKKYGSEYECKSFATKQAHMLYLLNAAKEGLTVPGVENIAPTVLQQVKLMVRDKKPVEYGDDEAFSTYMLGLAANPTVCDSLDIGELAVFMCLCQNAGGYDIFDDHCTPEILDRCFADLTRIYENPDKKLIRRLAKLGLFNMLSAIAGDSPTDRVDKMCRDSLYMRATLVGDFEEKLYWDDIDTFTDLVEHKFITFPIGEWPDWANLIGQDHFMGWYIACMNPDSIYDDPTAINCIIRYVTGHDMFCSEDDLGTPGKTTDIKSDIQHMLRYVSYDCRRRLSKVIAAKISPLVEDGKIVLNYPALKELGKNGMINPKAYRIGMERCASAGNGQADANAEISVGEIWRLIRSPMLPQLLSNTLTKKFNKYKAHHFSKGHEYMDERDTALSFAHLVDKMQEKASYYQIMRTVDALEESGILQQMTAFGAKLEKACSFTDIRARDVLGYDYGYYYMRMVIRSIRTLNALATKYKANPIPEPATKTRKRKVNNGTAA